MWLWNVKDYLSFDYGPYRVQEFERADTEGWSERCHAAVRLAATNVQQLRAEITDVVAAAGALSARQEVGSAGPAGWPTFDAAVASGLVGDVDRARELFDRLLIEDGATDWHRAMQATAAGLQLQLDDPAAFRTRVVSDIGRTRAALKLRSRAAPEIDASLEAGAAPGPG